MLNKIICMGRLGKDPEMRRTDSGKAVTSFSIACDRDFGDKETDWIDIVCWNKTAEFAAKYFQKGRVAIVSGRLQMRSWTDKNGNKRTSAEVVADNVYFGDSKHDSEPSYGGNSYGGTFAPPAEYEPIEDSDVGLPF